VHLKKTLTGLAALLCLATTVTGTADAAAPVVARHTGTLADGATWIADVPANWNGSLVLFSHGFRPGPDNPAADAPDPATADALLHRGFALAGSSYAHAGWALDTAVADQLDTLAAVGHRVGRPREVLAYGQSMGGLVSALLAERGRTAIDGALTTCGLVGGALNLNNYQLDGTYAVASLLLPGEDVQLTGFTTAAQAQATADRLAAALRQAQTTAAGRARIALAATLFDMPDWAGDQPRPAPTDYAAREQGQYEIMLNVLQFVLPARVSINAVAGGDSSWNAGVDYARLLRRSADRDLVQALYREAGAPLGGDLTRLTAGARIRPSAAAIDWLGRTSVPTGRLAMPELTLHTVSDELAPVQYESEYSDKVAHAGKAALLRQAYVARAGHCRFTPAESVAALLTLQDRVRSGHWGGTTEAAALQAKAATLGLGDAAFERYRPGPFVNDRADHLPGAPR